MAAVAPASASSVSLVWEDLTYSVKIKKGEVRTILDKVSGFVDSGRLCALMGPSGSGKSTLLDVLCDRVPPGNALSGTKLVNGRPVEKGLMKRIAGYVPQEDFLQAAMTVRENIAFSAELRLSKHIPRSEKLRRVDEVIRELNLEKVADSKVGDGTFIRGISGGEKKRVSIGMELVTAPALLFLDEPTTGLDSSTATSVMKLLKRLARSGRTIIASIHQPKYAIWTEFDELVLLSNGRVVYAGAANPDKAAKAANESGDGGLLAYFNQLGFHCETFNSPPDFALDVITEDEARQRRRKLIAMGQDPDDPNATTMTARRKSMFRTGTGSSDAAPKPSVTNGAPDGSTVVELSSAATATSVDHPDALPGTISTIPANNNIPIPDLFASSPQAAQLDARIAEYRKAGGDMPPAPERERPNPFFELFVVLQRQILAVFRNPRTWIIQVASNVLLAFIFGILFFQLGFTQESVQNRNGVNFFVIQFLVFSNMGAVELFLVDRRIFYHERANGYYRTFSYFLSKVVGDLVPLRIIPAFLFGTIIYWMVGFQANAGKFFFYLLALFVTTFAGTSLAFAISSYVNVFALGTLLLGACYLIMMVFGGLFINLNTIPVWLRWLQWFSIFKFGVEAVNVNEFSGLTFECPPPGQPCLFPTGEAYLAFAGFNPNMMWPDIGILLAWSFFYLTVAYIGLALKGKK
ncbi:P-loop containing nucleoside triphosphate hydrolase protein [Hyaloraphidium curvatum]|nr:P-loop containing nucleoside triphosphate hydrolase protein [Hyaloraphidium curvatum]